MEHSPEVSLMTDLRGPEVSAEHSEGSLQAEGASVQRPQEGGHRECVLSIEEAKWVKERTAQDHAGLGISSVHGSCGKVSSNSERVRFAFKGIILDGDWTVRFKEGRL